MPGPATQTLIRTYSGLELDVCRLEPDLIRIEDIAHALALCNRFAGHTKRPISVAQHSVYAARIVAELLARGPDSAVNHHSIIRQALLHDAAEAYVGDVTKWLKQTKIFENYRILEDIIQAKIYRKFGCPVDQHEFVSYADRILVLFEGRKGFGPGFVIDHPDYPNLSQSEIDLIGPWSPWSWKSAEELFLVHYRMYAEVMGAGT